MADTFEIRLASHGDRPAIDEFASIAVHDTYDPLVDDSYADELLAEWWGSALDPDIAADLVHVAVEASGRVIGFLHLGEHDNLPIIWKLYVAPERRGSGIGPRLIDAAIARLPSSTPQLLVEHITANTRVGHFYDREGFVVERIDSDPADARLGTVWRSLRLPHRRLAAGESAG